MHFPAALLLMFALLAAACFSPATSTSCSTSEDCFHGEECLQNRCAPMELDAGGEPDTTEDTDSAAEDADGVEPLGLPRYDKDFGQAGFVGHGISSRHLTASALVLQTDGKFVIVGSSSTLENNRGFALLRLEEDGSPDPSFGEEGFVLTPIEAELFFCRGAALDGARYWIQ
ncbi:MAG: delta-60 repeat domain-containing protein [Bradymonadaceae bacterium]